MLHFTAFAAGIVSVFFAQYLITQLWAVFGVTWGPGNLPTVALQKTAMLLTTFVAGVVGPIVATLICRSIPWAVLSAMCVFGLAIDIYAATSPLETLELWFRIVFVVSVPVQIVCGGYLGHLFLTFRTKAPSDA